MRAWRFGTVALAVLVAVVGILAGTAYADPRVSQGLPDAEREMQIFPSTFVWNLNALVGLAARDLDRFWRSTLESIERRYVSPEEVAGYTTPVQTGCGQARPNNAFYCGRSHTIHFDLNFLQRILDKVGAFSVITVIAHEWGHAIQAHFGLFSSLTIQSELQADCLAGVYARHAVDNNPLWNASDAALGAKLLGLVGDSDDVPWHASGAHGQPEQRSNAFDVGLQFGIERCFGVF